MAFDLAQPGLTAWLAIHAGFRMDQMQPARLVELVCVIRKDTALGTLQWPALTALLAETRTARFAYPARALVEHLVPGPLPPEVIAAALAAVGLLALVPLVMAGIGSPVRRAA